MLKIERASEEAERKFRSGLTDEITFSEGLKALDRDLEFTRIVLDDKKNKRELVHKYVDTGLKYIVAPAILIAGNVYFGKKVCDFESTNAWSSTAGKQWAKSMFHF